MRVLNAAGTVVAIATGLGIPSLDVPLRTTGVHYVSVAPAGSGSPATDGFSTYGSRGQYMLQVTVPIGTPPSVRFYHCLAHLCPDR